MDWVSLGFLLFGFACIGWGFFMLGLEIRKLQRKVESITEIPPVTIKYVMCEEKEVERL